jgi:RNA polymerase sigma-70 factor (ECF subfamily)
MMRVDPLANPEPLIRRVYSYVAYRLGDGAEAEDVTSEVFERALRYRASFDDARGGALPWLLGIARRCVHDALVARVRTEPLDEDDEPYSPEDLGSEAVERVALAAAVALLDERSRDLLALRYGADLTARQIAEVTGMNTNAVEVALHRALGRLRSELTETVDVPERSPGRASPRAAPP